MDPLLIAFVAVLALACAAFLIWLAFRGWEIYGLMRWSFATRRIWDDFGGECGNDSDYCRWAGDPEKVGKCYCQETAWRHAALALGRKK